MVCPLPMVIVPQWVPGSTISSTCVRSRMLVRQPSADGAGMFIDANGSGIAGAPDCGAGVIGPLATPVAWVRPAVTLAPPSAVTFWFDCTRHLLAVSSELFWTSRLSAPLLPELSTQSGSSPRVDAVAWACSFQPPGGSRLPKNDGRVPSTETVTLELSDEIVVVTVTSSRVATCASWPVA